MQNSGEDKANDYDGTLGSDSGGEAVLKAGAGITVGGQAVELSRGSAPNGGYISAPNAAFQAAGNSLTISMWLKLTDNPTWNHIFSMGTDKNHYALLATVGNPYGTPVGLTMGINNGSGEYRVAAAPADTVLPGDWAMVTYCQDEQGRAAFYLNGQLVESTWCYYADMTEKGDGTIPVGFGDVAGSNNSGGVYFGKNAIFEDPATDGLIGEIRVYDDVLSGDAIAALYHNHHFEFERFGDKTGFEILVENTDPKYVQFEPDVHWIQRAGQNPIDWIRRLAGRESLVHLKDYRIRFPEGDPAPDIFTREQCIQFAELGQGNLDIPEIIKVSLECGAEYLPVEQDQTYGKDPFQCLKESVAYIKSIGYQALL